MHVGALIIDGSRDTGWIFRHADGSLYGGVDLDVSRLEASSEAFGALRKLGYAESLIKRALAGIRATSPDLSTQELIRAALNTLQRKRVRVVPHPASRVGEPETSYGLFPRGKTLGSYVERRPDEHNSSGSIVVAEGSPAEGPSPH